MYDFSRQPDDEFGWRIRALALQMREVQDEGISPESLVMVSGEVQKLSDDGQKLRGYLAALGLAQSLRRLNEDMVGVYELFKELVEAGHVMVNRLQSRETVLS